MEALVAAGALVVRPGVGAAQGVARDHQVKIEVPALAENPTAVPVRVSVEHPMEPDHFIRWIDVVIDTDPVAHKGTYRFSPGNGQAWLAFPMRSGGGGVVKATAECSRHGRFSGTREMRVASDGCATFGGGSPRDQMGNPRLRLARAARAGETVEVRAKIDHDSDTGLELTGGKYVRVRPELFVKQVQVYLDRELVSEFTFTSALSPNPLIRFPVKVRRPGLLRTVFVNNEGRRWEATETLRPE
jgi:desulfoferrodoxin (superoxide reductase-like protein)